MKRTKHGKHGKKHAREAGTESTGATSSPIRTTDILAECPRAEVCPQNIHNRLFTDNEGSTGGRAEEAEQICTERQRKRQSEERLTLSY